MNFKGMMAGGTSHNGVSIDVLKSGVQKYIRRGIFEKAIWCAMELDMFHELLHAQPTTGLKALSTNILNRLIITSVEDVGIGNPYLPIVMQDLIDVYMASRMDPSMNKERMNAVYDMVYIMSHSMKSRELSHIKCVYHEVPSSLTVDDPEEAFIRDYDEGRDDCFRWFLALHYGSKRTARVLHHVMAKEDGIIRRTMDILHTWYRKYSFKEHVLFGMQIILLGLRRMDEPEPIIVPHRRDMPNNKVDPPITIDPYIIDVHTREGKRRGMSKSKFVIEGAMVNNEHPITNQEYKKIYMTYRSTGIYPREKMDGKISGRFDTSTLDGHPRGQLLTSRSKKEVWIPNERIVIKGPWRGSDLHKINTMLYRQEVLTMMNVPIVGMKVYLGSDGEAYTIYRNIGTKKREEWTYQTKYSSILGKDIDVVDRQSMGIEQLHHLTLEQQMDIMFGEQFLFRSICLLNMLKIGDINPANILIVDGKAFIIDIDDTRRREGYPDIGYLYAKSHQRYISLFKEGIEKNKDKVIEMLESVENDIPDVMKATSHYQASMNIAQEWEDIKTLVLS